MFTSNCSRYPQSLKLTGFVLNVSKSSTVCLLSLTQLIYWLNLVTQGYVFLPCLFSII
ncbi:hypothetical protein Hanom_Chr04g00376311 [Helianthus anomalus]